MDIGMDETQKKRYSIKSPGRGGARPNSGRKLGGTNKITGATILESIEKYSGEKFEDLLAQGYIDSITNDDRQMRIQYEKMFLGKVVADKVSLDITDNQDIIDARKQAFMDAIADLTQGPKL